MRELDSIDVLSYIIKKCVEKGISVGYTKAQKLLYCCYGVALAKYNIRLCREHPKAWTHGPAFPRAFNAHHKNKLNFAQNDLFQSSNAPEGLEADLISTIVFFGKYTATSLSNWTHQPSSPWSVCSNDGAELYNDLDDHLIQAYFKTQVLGDGA